MKKVSIILLLCIYTISTFGISVREFYCCGKLQSVSLSLPGKDVIKYVNEHDQSDCCKTKVQYYKIKDNHYASTVLISQVNPITYLHIPSSFTQKFPSTFQQTVFANSTHAPPIHFGVPSYISNCIFRI